MVSEQPSLFLNADRVRHDPPETPNTQDGFFAADGMVRRVHREFVIYAAGPRSLLLQYAHPQVAAGLREYSELKSRPIRRMLQTIQTMETMIFGTRSQAAQASHRTASHHARVQGIMSETQGRYPQGTSYSAATPDLLLWVLATLIDSSVYYYDALVAPLSMSEREKYYQEIRAASPLLGLTLEQMPPSYVAFRAYFDGVLTDGTLSVGEAGRKLAAELLAPRHLGAQVSFAARALAAATLPAELQAAFGLAWTWRERLTARALMAMLRTFAWVMPQRIRKARPWRVSWRSSDHAASYGRPTLSISLWLQSVLSA